MGGWGRGGKTNVISLFLFAFNTWWEPVFFVSSCFENDVSQMLSEAFSGLSVGLRLHVDVLHGPVFKAFEQNRKSRLFQYDNKSQSDTPAASYDII